MKVGIIIPVTSRKTNWKTIQETYLFTHFSTSFNNTKCDQYEYIIYIGYDENDLIFDNDENINIIKKKINATVNFIKFNNIPKGYLTKMWNNLFDIAYNDNCDYFYQCGDDIYFLHKGWTSMSIKMLLKNDNIGITGPININGKQSILTQIFLSRFHKKVFGYFFPEEIKNTFCDDWINFVYKNNRTYKLNNHHIINASCKGTGERYKSYKYFDRGAIFNQGRSIFKQYFKKK